MIQAGPAGSFALAPRPPGLRRAHELHLPLREIVLERLVGLERQGGDARTALRAERLLASAKYRRSAQEGVTAEPPAIAPYDVDEYEDAMRELLMELEFGPLRL